MLKVSFKFMISKSICCKYSTPYQLQEALFHHLLICERFVCGTVGLFSLLINSIVIHIDIHTCPELQTSSSSRSVLLVILSLGVLRDLAYSVCTEN